MKKIILIVSVFTLLLGACRTHTATTTPNDRMGDSMEDYIVMEKTIGDMNYKIVNYAPIEEWFLAEAKKTKTDDEIVALYDKLPAFTQELYGPSEDYDKKQAQVLRLVNPIINQDESYLRTKNAFTSPISEQALEKTMSFYKDLFPDLSGDFLLVINPFFVNGGMGVVQDDNGKTIGRLEISTSIMSSVVMQAINESRDEKSVAESDQEYIEILIAHEMTHVVHQLYGLKVLTDPNFDFSTLTEDFPLFTEGLASYYSEIITGNHNYERIFGDPAYSSVRTDDAFISEMATKFANDALDKPIDNAIHERWFDGQTSENSIFLGYPAIGYYFGYYVVKDILESEAYTLKTLMEAPVMEMMPVVQETVKVLQ